MHFFLPPPLSLIAAAAASSVFEERAPYLRPHVLSDLLGGGAVVGVHGLELALDRALPLFAVLVLRRHPSALRTNNNSTLLWGAWVLLLLLLLLLRALSSAVSAGWADAKKRVFGPHFARARA